MSAINLEIKKGEVVGIIGKNGAGKSTLLKLLSEVTTPTTGSIKMKGRIAALLEVGTGFHPELTGRENVFLNGAILGMTKKEISAKLEEIIDFSGVAKYIDTPVKRYSSGMKVRLGFAVAAHLEPEILIVDEVLAVGDAEFQKKCIGKMKDVAGEGRTVLFVSHNMESIEALCSSCIVMKNGEIIAKGSTAEMIDFYLKNNAKDAETKLENRQDRDGNGKYLISEVRFYIDGIKTTYLRVGRPGKIRLTIKRKERCTLSMAISIGIHDSRGVRITTLSSIFSEGKFSLTDDTEIEFELNKIPLYAGKYYCNVFLRDGEQGDIVDWVQDAFILDIQVGDYFGLGKNNTSQKDKIYLDHKINLP